MWAGACTDRAPAAQLHGAADGGHRRPDPATDRRRGAADGDHGGMLPPPAPLSGGARREALPRCGGDAGGAVRARSPLHREQLPGWLYPVLLESPRVGEVYPGF